MANMTTLQILQGIKTWVTTKLNLKQDVINDLANIRSGAQAGSTAVQPAELSAYFNDASYDNNTHRINFYHGQTVVAYVDASPFIIDGMVDDVRIENGYLVIDFNTASGKQDISIPLTDIFNPNNYYNKTQTDGLLAQKQDVIQDLADIRSGASAGSTAVQPSTLNNVVKNVVAESGVYDVSANNDNTKFESLSALLSSANLNTLIPTDIRKGGMSIKFVLSSDNNYIQFRCKSQSFSVNPEDWYFEGDETLIENPEWIYVLLDAEKRILAGLKSDGSVEWSIGIPTPVKVYIENAIAEIKNGTESADLDGLNKIIAFLSEFSTSDTLKELLDTKVDKVEGKSLIDAEYADSIHYIENPEFVEVKIDSKNRIILAIKTDGTIYYGAGVPQQIIDYINSKINELPLDEYDNIVTFLGNLINEDKTLTQLFAEKVDSKLLYGKELFTIGDSLSVQGVWQEEVCAVTECSFSKEKNIKPGSQLSTGGTISYGGRKDCGLARILNLKKENYHPDIIMLENVNDGQAFDNTGQLINGTINDTPYIINQILEGYSLADWQSDAATLLQSIPIGNRKFGTSLQLTYRSDGKNLKILTRATTEGDITLKVYVAQTGTLRYGIHVTTTDTIADIVNKILEYNYTMITDSLDETDPDSVNFSSGNNTYPCRIEFEDTDNTGVTVSITDTNNALGVTPMLFKGIDLTNDWEDPTKWDSTLTFASAWKGMIEFAKNNFPKALLVVLLFPHNSMDVADYTNADGTFDQEAYNTTSLKYKGMFEAQEQIAKMYNVPVINAHKLSGITVGNYLSYYNNLNVHPKDVGYIYFGRIIAKQLLSIY